MSELLHGKYAYKVVWSQEDEEFVGTCAEFPSLSFLAETQTDALTGIIDLVGDVIDDMQDSGEEIPVPLSLKKYSGKFQVRTAPEIHRDLTIEAAEMQISLNRLVNTKLARI